MEDDENIISNEKLQEKCHVLMWHIRDFTNKKIKKYGKYTKQDYIKLKKIMKILEW